MILWGYREQANNVDLYHFYDSDRELCHAVSEKLGTEHLVTVRSADKGKPFYLRSHFDTEATRFKGLRRYIYHYSPGRSVFGTLELNSRWSTLINEKFLTDNSSHIVRFWSPDRPREPVAWINLEKRLPWMEENRLYPSSHCYLFCCDDSVDWNSRLLMLLYPALKFD